LRLLSVIDDVLASPEFFHEPNFNIWYFCMPNWCLVLCICGNVNFMTTVKTHLLWLKFKMISNRLMHWFYFYSYPPKENKFGIFIISYSKNFNRLEYWSHKEFPSQGF
jgi:hypothetical protein